MATTRSKIVAELIGTAGTIDNAKLTGSISNDKSHILIGDAVGNILWSPLWTGDK